MRFFYFLPLLAMLQACGQADYTTWNCFQDGQSSKKEIMVLQQSTMTLGDRKLHFCGSLGLVSYFDKTCNGAEIKQAFGQFIQSESRLIIGLEVYRCEKL